MATDDARLTDPELRAGPRQDLHSLRDRDVALDSLCADIQLSAATQAATTFGASADMAALRSMLCEKPALVTGSAGYLGRALVLTLRALDVAVKGIDVVPGTTVDMVVDVADSEEVRRCGAACGAVFHCAALHAPHATSWPAHEFTATNVVGTENVLALGLPTVHTSTTSLTITRRVKAREAAGELVWLGEDAQRPDDCASSAGAYDPHLDAPRNKYGRSKLEAEQRCLAAARDGADVVILRAPRFFPEDALEGSSLSTPNLKANELLGRRCALVDLLDAELRALARVKARARGLVLTLAAPWPLERPPGAAASSSSSSSSSATSAREAVVTLRARFPHADALYARHGWRLPDAVTRVYDSGAALEALGWRPRVTFAALLRRMEQHEEAQQGGHAPGEDCARPGKQQRAAAARDNDGVALEDLLRGAY